MTELGLAFALILVIEGTLYALFPEAMKRMMSAAQQQPLTSLRWMGVFVATVGVVLVWVIRQ